MILVLVSVSIAFVIGLTFLAASTTASGIAQTMDHHAQARQIAESGLSMAVRYVQQTPDWRDVRSSGTWINDLSLFGGTVSVTGQFDPASAIAINDHSFEQTVAELANPVLNPPMSGSVGGWQLTRTAAVVTGPTVPHIGTMTSAGAIDGNNQAFITCTAAVNGTGTFSQTLAVGLEPQTVYEVMVDIGTSGIPLMDSNHGLRVLAGNTVVASTEHAWALQMPAPPSQPPTPPAQPPSPPEMQSVLEVLGLSGGFSQFTLRFATDSSPPAGLVSIELFVKSTGVVTSVYFDDVRLRKLPQNPLVITAVGHHGDASHAVTASVATVISLDGTASAEVVRWSDM